MAGTSDVTFRAISAGLGSALGVTELVTARGIRYDPSLFRCYRFLEIDTKRESAAAIQLFGYDPKDFAAAIPIVLEHPVLKEASFIDINMGCPVPKVVKTGAGSALMRTPELAEEIIRTAVKAAEPYHVPVTVKFRKGWDENHVNAPDFAKRCIEAGAKMICVHARTRSQMYSGEADWHILSEVVKAVSDSKIPVLGNGDVKNGVDARRMLEETGVDGVLVGRAAQGNPWVFREIKAELMGVGGKSDFLPSREEKVRMILFHARGLSEKIGQETAMKEMRAQFAYYLKGERNAAEYKNKLMRTSFFSEAEEILEAWLERE